MYKVYAFVLMAVFSGIALNSSRALASNTQQAEKFVEEVGQKIVTLIASRTLSQSEKENQFRNILKESFDLPSIGRFVLGRYWRTASPQEREEYARLFEDVVVKTYASQFDDYNNETLKVTSAIETSDGGVIVQSQVLRPANQPPLSVDWKIYLIGGKLRVLDISVSGVSMAISQRSEYAATIRRHGGQIGGLLTVMRAQAIGQRNTDS